MSVERVAVQDYKAVEAVVSAYIEAVRAGDVARLHEVFHEDSVTFGVVEGQLLGGTGNPTAAFIQAHGGSPEIGCHIDVLDITRVTAMVRVDTENDAAGAGCREFLTLVKAGERWVIMSKAFVQFD